MLDCAKAKQVKLVAYAYPTPGWKQKPERRLTGFYADVSGLAPDTRHGIEVTLPESLKPGQFQGLFFENLEAEWTTTIAGRP
ncbi:MAG TPA: hypothetical protein PK640_00355 [Verrucomicrobiota bacterium]|nr:hypothetical protein [Verrucomicrobiota bacterium]